jgi:hypothetical protein
MPSWGRHAHPQHGHFGDVPPMLRPRHHFYVWGRASAMSWHCFHTPHIAVAKTIISLEERTLWLTPLCRRRRLSGVTGTHPRQLSKKVLVHIHSSYGRVSLYAPPPISHTCFGRRPSPPVRPHACTLAGGHRSSVELRPSRNPSSNRRRRCRAGVGMPTHSTGTSEMCRLCRNHATTFMYWAERQPCRGIAPTCTSRQKKRLHLLAQPPPY